MKLKLENIVSPLLFFFIICFSQLSFSQVCDLTSRNFITYLGTTDEDKVSFIQKIGDEGYIVASAKAIGSNYKFYLSRTDICGGVLWEKIYNEANFGLPVGVEYVDGVIYVATYYNSPSKTALVKLDLDGNILACNKFGANSTYPRGLIYSSDSNFIFGGVTNASGGSGINDFYISKSTVDGTILWNKQYGGAANDFCQGILEDTYGNILSVGYTRNYLPGIRRGVAIKLDDTGNVLWGKEYHNGSGESYIFSAMELDDFYYLSGRINTGSFGMDDGLLLKTNLDGEIIWAKFIGTTGNDFLLSMSEKDGVIYVGGVANSLAGNVDAIIVQLDTAGNLIDYTSLGTTSDEFNFLTGKNFDTEPDGFYGVTAGNTGEIGDKDILFYRFNSFADNCSPSELDLSISDASLTVSTFVTTSITPTWSSTSVSITSTSVPVNQGFICEEIDTIECADIVISDVDTILCLGDSITLDAYSSTGSTIIWDGGITNGISFLPELGTTTYTASSDSIGDCPASIDITVVAPPAITANASETTICIGDSVTLFGEGADSYTWNMGIINNEPFAPTDTGTYLYHVEGVSAFGCSSEDSIFVTVHELPSSHFEYIFDGVSSEDEGLEICLESPVQFNDLSSVGYLDFISEWNWNFGDGENSTLENPTHIYTSTGNFTVSLDITSNYGCSSSSSLDIKIKSPHFSSTIIQPSCYGFSNGTITINADSTDIAEYFIVDELGLTRNTLTSNIANDLEAGDYHLKVIDEDGCYAEQSVYIEQPDSLEVSFSYTPNAIILDENVFFTSLANGATSWFWDFGDGNNSTEQNPIHTYTSLPKDSYLVTLKASNGNCSAQTELRINLNEILVFYIPNAFTPDGNNFNEKFTPIFTSGFDPYNYHLTIYNRWGEILFESFDANKGWDGTYANNGIVEDGVYIWQIKFGDINTDKNYIYTGHFSLLK